MSASYTYSNGGRPVLTLADIVALHPNPTSDPARLRLCCPIHGGDNPTSFSVNRVTGYYHCFACGTSGRLREFWHMPVIETATYTQLSGAHKSPLPNAANRYARWLADSRLDPRANHAGTGYLTERGISVATARECRVGYAPRFRFEAETRCSALLFGLVDRAETTIVSSVYSRACCAARLHRVTRGAKGVFVTPGVRDTTLPVIVVEGVFDALALVESGYAAVCALIGLNPHPALFAFNRPLVLALDNDAAGKTATQRIRDVCRERRTTCLRLPRGRWDRYKDFADYWQAEGYARQHDWPTLLGSCPPLT